MRVSLAPWGRLSWARVWARAWGAACAPTPAGSGGRGPPARAPGAALVLQMRLHTVADQVLACFSPCQSRAAASSQPRRALSWWQEPKYMAGERSSSSQWPDPALRCRAGIGATEAGGHPPVDVAHLVAGLIGAQLAKGEPRRAAKPALRHRLNARARHLPGPQPDRQQSGEGRAISGWARDRRRSSWQQGSHRGNEQVQGHGIASSSRVMSASLSRLSASA